MSNIMIKNKPIISGAASMTSPQSSPKMKYAVIVREFEKKAVSDIISP
jgi:hypothetical protein